MIEYFIHKRWLLAFWLTFGVACDPDSEAPPDAAVDAGTDAGLDGGERDPRFIPVFPEDFEASYIEMRDCRHSHEHELRYIRVLASPTAREPYAALTPEVPYPVGATLVKLEYDDEGCETVVGYTAMRKQPEGTVPAGKDWMWQKLTVDREVTEGGAPRVCIDCHREHCAPPNGYDLSCAEEL